MNYNNSTAGFPQQNYNYTQNAVPVYQFPYGASSNLINNAPYNNYMGQNNLQQQQSNQFLKCRPVSSRDEARAFQIDLDGSLWVFTDLGSGKIYTKQINTDGTATFKTYQLTEDQNPYSNQYVTKDQFNKTIQSIVAAIQNNGKEGGGSQIIGL